MESFLELFGLASLAIAIAAIPAALIGRKIDRTFDAIYLGMIWGLWLAIIADLPEILVGLLPFFSTPNSLAYTALKTVHAALIGGSCGGLTIWSIKAKTRNSSPSGEPPLG